MNDREIVERQLGRPPRAFRRAAVRCPFGLPAVTEQAPFDAARTPFPTQFWLTCPHLGAALARPGYTLGDRILAEASPLWPSKRCCSL